MQHVSGQLRAAELTVAYEQRTILDGFDVTIPSGSFTVIVGPNACGKSTLLRSLARLLPSQGGHVYLDAEDIRTMKAKDLAKRIGLLPQTSVAPDSITIADLVSRGRYPHQGILKRWSNDDDAAVEAALAATKLTDLADRSVDELSGGQRQRVWIAMVLAQDTPVVLLDEPTTYLDLAHQIDVLDLCAELHRQGRTLIAVLHDLNQAARYATHLIALKAGKLIAEGTPSSVVTEELVAEVFGVRARVVPDPETGTPLVIPLASSAIVEQPAERVAAV